MQSLISNLLRGPLAVTLILVGCPAQKPQAPDPHMSCIETLEIPAYPALATQGRMEGGVFRVSIDPGQAGTARRIRIDSNSHYKPFFEPAIQASMRKSSFLPACSSQTVEVVFNFTLGDNPPRETVAFRYPNEFWITAQVPLVQTQTSGQNK